MTVPSSTEAIQHLAFDEAEKLLEFLDPRGDHWNPDRNGWIFRGQSEDWLLKPKLYRDGPWFEELGLSAGALKVAQRQDWRDLDLVLIRQRGRRSGNTRH